MALQQVEVRNRWTGEVQFTASIECAADALPRVKLGLAVKWARQNGVVLRGADLSGADLRGAVLRDAVLSGAVLSDAVLSGAVLRDAVLRGADLRGAVLRDCPVRIDNIHRAVYEAASKPGALEMSSWHHVCGTSHCRAGWIVELAGDGGKALEWAMGTAAAAAMIYMASDPGMEKIPDFYCDNETAMADMARLAEVSK